MIKFSNGVSCFQKQRDMHIVIVKLSTLFLSKIKDCQRNSTRYAEKFVNFSLLLNLDMDWIENQGTKKNI